MWKHGLTPTLGGVIELMRIEEYEIKFDGATADFLREYQRRHRAVGEAIKKQLGIASLDELQATPGITELNPVAVQRFRELIEWLNSQTKAEKMPLDHPEYFLQEVSKP